VLFLAVELCALSFRRDDWSNSNMVATALFGARPRC
jgi:alkylresorcinol/alkylpyrone synthase